jgi:predicted transcriptional regulator
VPNRDHEKPEDGTSERILHYIQEKPACHLRQIKEDLELGMGTVQYQLERLEKVGKISSVRRGLYKHYFPLGMVDKERNILQILGQETAREILMFIIEKRNPTNADISNRAKISSATVTWHTKRLIEIGLISEEREGKYKRYRLQCESRQVAALLKNYYPSIWDNWSNRLAEIFLSFSRVEEKES